MQQTTNKRETVFPSTCNARLVSIPIPFAGSESREQMKMGEKKYCSTLNLRDLFIGGKNMILFKVTHKYKLDDHFERKDIGIYSSKEKAWNAIEELKPKAGFCDTQNGVRIRKVFRLFKPKLMDRTYWIDGFVTYTY